MGKREMDIIFKRRNKFGKVRYYTRTKQGLRGHYSSETEVIQALTKKNEKLKVMLAVLVLVLFAVFVIIGANLEELN